MYDQHVTFLLSLEHIRKEEHHKQWAVLSGISPTVEKGCTKDLGKDKKGILKKKKGKKKTRREVGGSDGT